MTIATNGPRLSTLAPMMVGVACTVVFGCSRKTLRAGTIKATPDAAMSAEGGMIDADVATGGSDGSPGAGEDLVDLERDSPASERLDATPDGGSTGGGETGVLELVAGGLGGPGDLDGIGAAARFRSPSGVASDGAGHLFVTDEASHVVRRIDLATGAVTTLGWDPQGRRQHRWHRERSAVLQPRGRGL